MIKSLISAPLIFCWFFQSSAVMLTRHHILGSHGHISGLSGKIGTSVLVVGTADVHAFQKYCEVLLYSVVIVQSHIVQGRCVQVLLHGKLHLCVRMQRSRCLQSAFSVMRPVRSMPDQTCHPPTFPPWPPCCPPPRWPGPCPSCGPHPPKLFVLLCHVTS